MIFLSKKLNSSKIIYKIFWRMFIFTLIFIQTFLPFIQTITIPFSEEKIQLGFPVNKAEAAFGNGYDYRRSITVNESQVLGSGDFTDFPILISLSEPEFRTTSNGGNVTNSSGFDIVFASDDQGVSTLDYEMERYNAVTGEITAWVRIPTLDFDDDTIIYVFYGNSSISVSQEDIPGTWNSSYKGVWHMEGDGSTQLDSADSTVSHDATVSGATPSAVGKVGYGYDFDGVNDVLTVSDESELDLTNTATFEAWVRTDDVTTYEAVNTNWVSATAPASSGASMWSGVDSVIVGDTEYFGGILCSGTTATFRTAERNLDRGSFSAWTSRTATGTPASTGGCDIAVDSDGKELWFAVYSSNAATLGRVAYGTSTLNYTGFGSSSWKPLDTVTTVTSAAEASGIDMVITGDRAYFAIVALAGTTEYFRTGSVRLDGSGWTGWTTQITTNLAGGASEGCSVGINTDGVKLYYAGHCHDGITSTFSRSWSNLDGTSFSGWQNDTDPAVNNGTGSGASDYNYVDSTLIGGHGYYAFYGHEGTDENWGIASSSPQGGSVSTWLVASSTTSGFPNGAGAVETSNPSVESDGKSIFYTAFSHNSTTGSLQYASTTLPAHPFISKHGAYEAIQTGKGYVFDWAGKPTTFGTTTSASTFYHVAVTHDGTYMNYYIDGTLMSSTTVSTDFWTNSNSLLIGGGNRSTSTPLYFNGIIDEVRVSSSARSSDWILTQYNNQNSTSTFYTLGDEEESIFSLAPTVNTNFVSNVGPTTVILNGNIVSTGDGDNITVRGFTWGTNSNLSGGDTATTSDTVGQPFGAGSFSGGVSISGSQTYYFRAYATNSGGTSYGVIRSFYTGNSTATRVLRLFEGFRAKFFDGRIIINQK